MTTASHGLGIDHATKAVAIPSPVEEPIPRASKVDTIKRSDAASLCFNSLQSSGPSMKQHVSTHPLLIAKKRTITICAASLSIYKGLTQKIRSG